MREFTVKSVYLEFRFGLFLLKKVLYFIGGRHFDQANSNLIRFSVCARAAVSVLPPTVSALQFPSKCLRNEFTDGKINKFRDAIFGISTEINDCKQQ